jgi:hypothetical protein
MHRAGLEVPAAYVKEGDHSRDVAVQMASELLGLAEPPTAIFAASDTQAFGVLEAAARAGVEVPARLSVIGFDDIEVAAYVGLTTVRQPLSRETASRVDCPAHDRLTPGLKSPSHCGSGPCGRVGRGSWKARSSRKRSLTDLRRKGNTRRRGLAPRPAAVRSPENGTVRRQGGEDMRFARRSARPRPGRPG